MNRKIRFANSRVLSGHLGSIYSLCTLGDELLSAGGDGNIVLWDIRLEKPGIVFANVATQIYTLSAHQELMVAGSMNGALFFIDCASRVLLKKIPHHQKGVFSILHIENSILTGGGDGMVTLWDVKCLLPLFSLQLSAQSIRCMVQVGSNEFIAGCSTGNLYKCQLRENSITILETKLQAHRSSVFSLSYDWKNQLLLSGGRDAQLNFWNGQLEQVHTIAAHLFTINAIAMQPTLGLFATASRDKTIKIWDLDQLTLIQVLEPLRDFGHFNSINALQWIGNSLFSGSDDKRIISWQSTEVTE